MGTAGTQIAIHRHAWPSYTQCCSGWFLVTSKTQNTVSANGRLANHLKGHYPIPMYHTAKFCATCLQQADQHGQAFHFLLFDGLHWDKGLRVFAPGAKQQKGLMHHESGWA